MQITRWRAEPNVFGEAADVSELGGVGAQGLTPCGPHELEQSGQGAPSGSIMGAAVTTCPHRAT